MKILTPRVHGILDYVTVAFFLVAPTLFGLSGAPAVISYVLAVVHLAMTVLTAFPLGLVSVIPFKVHGIVELVVAGALIVLPWLLGDLFDGARIFYTIVGAVIFIVWLLTEYQPTAPHRHGAPE